MYERTRYFKSSLLEEIPKFQKNGILVQVLGFFRDGVKDSMKNAKVVSFQESVIYRATLTGTGYL